jgi:hypothetical protein
MAEPSRNIDQEALEEEKKKRQEACAHEETKKKRLGGMDTGDKICVRCGKIM